MSDALCSTAPDSNRAGTSIVVGVPRAETVNTTTPAPSPARTALERPRRDRRRRRGPLNSTTNSRLRQLPADVRRHRDAHVPAARPRVALRRAGPEGGGGQPDLAGCIVRVADLFWQNGHGSKLVYGMPATGAITFWIPIVMFAFLFGLSMDYEVFILSRMREEYDRTGSTEKPWSAAWPARAAGDQRRADPVPCIRLAGLGPGHRHQGARHRARRRHPARMPRSACATGAVARVPDGPVELVVPEPVARLLRVPARQPAKVDPAQAASDRPSRPLPSEPAPERST